MLRSNRELLYFDVKRADWLNSVDAITTLGDIVDAKLWERPQGTKPLVPIKTVLLLQIEEVPGYHDGGTYCLNYL